MNGSNAFLRLERNGLAKQLIRIGDDDLNINSLGHVGIQTLTPTAPLDIDGSAFRVRSPNTPTSSNASGETGTIVWDSDYLYVCVATNSWKRVALSTW